MIIQKHGYKQLTQMKKRAIIEELLMPMMQPAIAVCVQRDRISVDIWSKIRPKTQNKVLVL